MPKTNINSNLKRGGDIVREGIKIKQIPVGFVSSLCHGREEVAYIFQLTKIHSDPVKDREYENVF